MAGLKIIAKVVILLAALCSSMRAQGETRSIVAVQAGTKPVIDGVLDDIVWSGADWQEDFIQLEPSMGEPARAATRFAMAFDDKHVYAAFRCFNPTGPSANSTVTRRDGDMDIDNAVTLYLDTFLSRRDCYYFSTNSLGIQVDGRIAEDGKSNDKSWDCNWRVASSEDSLGWTAEMAISVSEIRISRKTAAVWGVNVRRNYPDYFETSFWAERDKAWRVSQSGSLTGLRDFKKTFSAALYPYVVTLDANTEGTKRRTIYSSGGTQAITGADLRFNVGSSVNGNLTYNPDFATVEADQEVINLTRYETFFPEKRLYFLEGAELYKNRINVFYSRRIGDIDYGIKSNGRIGKTNFSVLSARERAAEGQPSSQTSVLRLQRDILGSSNIGLLAIDRTYPGGGIRVLSTDATIYFLGTGKFTSQAIGSFPSGDGKFTKAYFLRAARENELYHYHLRFTNIDPGFKDNVNTVGFIRDDDRRELDSDITYRWWLKRHGVERISFETRNNVFWSHSGALRNVKLSQSLGVTLTNKISVGFSNQYLTELFEKRFRNHTMVAEVSYNEEQWNQIKFVYQQGRNFERNLDNWIIRPRVKLGNKLALDYKFQVVKFSPDTHDNRVVNVLTADYNFTNDIYLRLFTQHDSRNDRFYVYGLFGWRFKPPFGALYLAYTADRFDTLDDSYLPVERENERTFFVKLTVPLNL
ncbi:MAG: carbohydrate binding family 9 domain-containing protein [Candidatus Glassbacteria bacterium]|nr:carbohydrate binding family 9 domain-containing protein [Candidatus Glassbacteria bacterium]